MTDFSETRIEPDMEGPGALLRRAREARGLMLRDIAQELHLDEWMLEALEKDDFAALGAPVFAKGHLRKVGSMLGLDTDDLMIAYYRKRGRDDTPPPITELSGGPPRERDHDRTWLRRSLLALAVLAVLFAVWRLLPRQPAAPDVAAPAVPAAAGEPAMERARPVAIGPAGLDPGLSLPAARPDGAADPSAATGAGDSSGEQVAAPPSGADVAGAAAAPETTAGDEAVTGLALEPGFAEPPATAPTVAPTVVLTLRLDGESWVEVTDRTGERLIYGMLGDGRSRTVSGQPPVEVFLGRARAVTLAVDGEDYPIPREAVRGNTARLVIGDER